MKTTATLRLHEEHQTILLFYVILEVKKPKSTCEFTPLFFLFYRSVGIHYIFVLVRENMAKKGIRYPPLCPRCGDDMELSSPSWC